MVCAAPPRIGGSDPEDDQWITGRHWERHRVPKTERTAVPERLRFHVDRLRDSLFPVEGNPWGTVRDALQGLPDPEISNGSHELPNHVYNLGARVYTAHTGSPLDEPAKTLKAGNHGVPGGENMMSFPDGRVRYFTVGGSTRLQTFPDLARGLTHLARGLTLKISFLRSVSDFLRGRFVSETPRRRRAGRYRPGCD